MGKPLRPPTSGCLSVLQVYSREPWDPLRRRAMSNSRISVRLVSELVIIFAGVYGAFWVERYRQEVEDRERALTILEALDRELENLSNNGPYVEKGMTQALDAFVDARTKGIQAPPAFYREPGAETPSISVWRATVSSGGVNLLDPGLFYSLAEFYNRVESFSERYLRYNEFTEREILPLLSRGGEAFYDPVSEELEPSFQVHMDQLRTLRDEASLIILRADSLVQVVRAEAELFR